MSVTANELSAPESKRDPMLGSRIYGLLKSSPAARKGALIGSLAIGIPIGIAVVWLGWFVAMPQLWHWSFEELSWRALPGIAGSFFLGVFPFAIVTFILMMIFEIVGAFAEVESERFANVLHRSGNEQSVLEQRLIDEDRSGLAILLRYSRMQLEQYYAIGLTQTQRSFRYGVIAMWIGFAVIVVGILIRVMDLKRYGLLPTDEDGSRLVILSGVVIEVVSALFLWLYRRSIKQLTYFYDRQMYNHGVLMCHRIAETMTSADDVKKTIVDNMLTKNWVLQDEGLPDGRSLMSVGAKKG